MDKRLIASIVFLVFALAVASKFLFFSNSDYIDYGDINYTEECVDMNATLLENRTWVGDVFYATHMMSMTCGGCYLYTDLEVKESTLVIAYEERCGEVVTNCFCKKFVTFAVPDLEKKDYSVMFVANH